MKERRISYLVAQIMKNTGMREECDMVYYTLGNGTQHSPNMMFDWNKPDIKHVTCAYTQQLVIDWLYQKYGVEINVYRDWHTDEKEWKFTIIWQGEPELGTGKDLKSSQIKLISSEKLLIKRQGNITEFIEKLHNDAIYHATSIIFKQLKTE